MGVSGRFYSRSFCDGRLGLGVAIVVGVSVGVGKSASASLRQATSLARRAATVSECWSSAKRKGMLCLAAPATATVAEEERRSERGRRRRARRRE